MPTLNGGKWIRRSTRLAILLRDKFTCVYCGRDLTTVKPKQATMDHVQPRILGGSNSPTNLVSACKACNSAKGDLTLADWATSAQVINVRNAVRRKLNRRLARSLVGVKGNKAVAKLAFASNSTEENF